MAVALILKRVSATLKANQLVTIVKATRNSKHTL